MKTLDPLTQPKLLLSFDFDGTLHEPATGHLLESDFFDLVKVLREEHQALWVINTGRSLYHMVEAITQIRFPFLPDHVIVREREIFTPSRFGRWVNMGKWNTICEKEHKKLFKKSHKQLTALRDFVEKETSAEWVDAKHEPAGLIAKSVQEMEAIAVKADEICASAVNLSYERNSIYMRFSHSGYHKGSALQEVQRAYSLNASHTFAVGDGHNDLKKLVPDVAKHLACPDNAVTEVKDAIVSAGGYVSSLKASQGSMDALRHYFLS